MKEQWEIVFGFVFNTSFAFNLLCRPGSLLHPFVSVSPTK